MLSALALLAAALAAATWWFGHPEAKAEFTTARVDRGPISRGVTATGTVNPVLTVVVGSYVSGVIQDIYCDYNTNVRKGQICARIDPRPYRLQVQQAQAMLDTARAQLSKDQASLDYARVSYARLSGLLAVNSTSRDSVDTARSALGQATAQVGLDRATIEERRAALNAARVNLGYTDIVSPVNGTVVSRNVTIGQTVAASFQTPTLFLIAQDLTNMQVDTNVSESDIESEHHGIQPGDSASFTVEPFPGRSFSAVVRQVRQAPQTVQNVVTYDVVVGVRNPDFKLRPGMTATVRISTQHRDAALRVPNAALHFNPAGLAGPRPLDMRARTGFGRVWVVRDGKPVAVPIRTGIADETYTEIVSGALRPGDEIIIGGGRGNGQARQRGQGSIGRVPRL